jgi:excisionase family DNA binding protein
MHHDPRNPEIDEPSQSVKAAAKRLGVNRDFLVHLISQNKIKGWIVQGKTGRITHRIASSEITRLEELLTQK